MAVVAALSVDDDTTMRHENTSSAECDRPWLPPPPSHSISTRCRCCVAVCIALSGKRRTRLGLVVDGFIYPVNFEFRTRHAERHYFSHAEHSNKRP